MTLETMPLQQITPYAYNPRINDQAVDALVESIQQCGYIAPIIVDENHIILAGHTRYKALVKLGRTEAEVIVKAGLSEEQKRKYRLLDNKVGELAKWDFDLLEQELDGLDFGGLNIDWGLGSCDAVEALDLEEDPQPNAGPQETQTMHCPKCGFIFEVKQ